VLEQVYPAGEGSGAEFARNHLRRRSRRRGKGCRSSLGIFRVQIEVSHQFLPAPKKDSWAQVAPVEISRVGRRVGANRYSTVGHVPLGHKSSVDVRPKVMPFQAELPLVRTVTDVTVVHLECTKPKLIFELKYLLMEKLNSQLRSN